MYSFFLHPIGVIICGKVCVCKADQHKLFGIILSFAAVAQKIIIVSLEEQMFWSHFS